MVGLDSAGPYRLECKFTFISERMVPPTQHWHFCMPLQLSPEFCRSIRHLYLLHLDARLLLVEISIYLDISCAAMCPYTSQSSQSLDVFLCFEIYHCAFCLFPTLCRTWPLDSSKLPGIRLYKLASQPQLIGCSWSVGPACECGIIKLPPTLVWQVLQLLALPARHRRGRLQRRRRKMAWWWRS
jgi:hypothetical protein